MKEQPGSERPKDSDKQGYKFLLDSLRDQLLRDRSLEGAAAETVETQTAAPATDNTPKIQIPEGKKFFRIGEVAEILGVEAYVLRYWETEFGSIRPKKSRSGQRIYDRRDVQRLALVHHLLYVEKFSLKGAKKKLAEMRKAPPPAERSIPRKALVELATDFKKLREWIRHNPG
ncbi:MerR family transcriptional regulator [bacterium]|nr:MerR family transcriptional regulator [bacterium]